MKSSEKKETPYPIAAIYAAILVGIVYYFWPNVYPWNFTHFWFQVGSLQDWIREVRWWYIIMGSFSIAAFLFSQPRREKLVSNDPIDYIKSGFVISILAGVFEEICYRWIFSIVLSLAYCLLTGFS